MAQDIPHNRLNVLENQSFQDFDTDEMPITLFFAFAVQRAVKKVLIEITVVDEPYSILEPQSAQ